MEFYDIKDSIKAHPGEYLFHVPSKQIVVCGAFKMKEGVIKALSNGKLLEDKIENFQTLRNFDIFPTRRATPTNPILSITYSFVAFQRTQLCVKQIATSKDYVIRKISFKRPQLCTNKMAS